MAIKQHDEVISTVMKGKSKWAVLVTPADPDAENGVEYRNGVLSFIQGGIKVSMLDIKPDAVIAAMNALTDFSFSGLDEESLNEHFVVIPLDGGDSMLQLKDYVFFKKIDRDIFVFENLGPKFDGEVQRLKDLRENRIVELMAEDQKAAEEGSNDADL